MRATLITVSIAVLAFLTTPADAAKQAGKARSAVSGKYVTKGYAAKNPRTTVVERQRKK